MPETIAREERADGFALLEELTLDGWSAAITQGDDGAGIRIDLFAFGHGSLTASGDSVAEIAPGLYRAAKSATRLDA